jgi:nucleoid-associated protein YgaU
VRNLSKRDREGPAAIHEVSLATIIRWAAPEAEGRPLYRPKPLQRLKEELDEAAKTYAAWEFSARGGYEGDALPDPIDKGGKPLRRYTIRSGESLETIAARELGDEKRVVEVLALNRTTIPDPDRYYVGQIINLPTE